MDYSCKIQIKLSPQQCLISQIPSLWLPEKANYATDYKGALSAPRRSVFTRTCILSACFLITGIVVRVSFGNLPFLFKILS